MMMGTEKPILHLSVVSKVGSSLAGKLVTCTIELRTKPVDIPILKAVRHLPMY